jgi:AraC-like DNA-binding protein/mannose-6-phosphate isomerase-like protein (cupin superfamily)
MSMLPLERYELFHSTNIDDARKHVTRILVPHRLDLIGRPATLDARAHSKRLSVVVANYIAYGGNVHIVPGELETFYIVQVPISGQATVTCGKQQALIKVGEASVVSPTEPLSMRWSKDCAMLLLRIERAALEAHLSDMADASLHEPIRFDLSMDVSKGYGLSWLNAFTMLTNELDRGEHSIMGVQPAARSVEDTLMTMLLSAQRHNYSDVLDGARPAVPNRAVRIVQELIHDHPEHAHTVASLARHANVSIRALQQGFARHLDTTPRTYLIDIRMERAHAELRAAQRDRITVEQVVSKWSLGHPGRFAIRYRKRFGESPSETLAS